MTGFESPPSADERAPRDGAYPRLAGERSIVASHRRRSLESRIGNVMALGIVGSLGFGLLAWYYHAALERPARRERGAVRVAMSRAESEMPLPPLGPIVAPRPDETKMRPPATVRPPSDPSAMPWDALPPLVRSGVSESPPSLPSPVGSAAIDEAGNRATTAPRLLTAAQRAMRRRLSGPVFAAKQGREGSATGSNGAEVGALSTLQPSAAARTAVATTASGPGTGELSELLTPSLTPAAVARVLPSRSLVLPKGSFIDCTLETAIDSTLPGMTTCVTATDTFGADGKVVLLERGSQLVGETRGVVEEGSARVFVLWTEARTPTGVVIPLASPGTDELGRSGLTGRVNRHFWQRFGAAILISVIDAGVESIAQSGGGTIIYDPSESEDVGTEVLRRTLRIAPEVIISQGDRIEVLVARDLDFRSVYALRSVNARR